MFIFCLSTGAKEINFTSWKFNDLSSIGGIPVTPDGNPELITILNDSAYLFDGTEDRVVINNNPLIGLEEFTIEIVFRIDEGGIAEQKILHIQANPDIRILFEVEFANDSSWYMENYIQTGSGDDNNIHLMDSNKLYPVNRWYHASVVYKNNEFKQYINYKTENTDQLSWNSPNDGSISIGARMNSINYMTGAVREVRFADTALDSTQFLFYGELLEQHETYILDNLVEINGHTIQYFGNPQVLETELGPGIEFDGKEDGMYIFSNPIESAKRFTIETIIKPNDVAPANAEPRYFHIEDGDNSNRRITMELRLNDNHEWYFDGFLKASSAQNIALIDETMTHPIDGWEHIAITYDNGLFKTYVNHSEELSSAWGPHFLPLGKNTKISLGMRMNKVNYYNGVIQRVRVTKAVLNPREFMTIDTGTSKLIKNNKEGSLINSGLHLDVYPNPANGIVNLQLVSSINAHVSVELYNTMGEKIDELLNSDILAGNTDLSINAALYPTGLYMVHIKNKDQILTKKLLIK